MQSSGSTPHFGARMSSYAWLGVVLATRAGRVDHPASPPTSQHGTLSDFWPMATMATMATLGADLLKKYRSPRILVGRLSPPLFPFILFSSFNSGWPWWPWGGHDTRIHRDPRPVHEDTVQALRGRVRDSPSAWRHSNGSELARLRDFWLVATKATMATLGSRPLKKYRYGFSWLVRYHPPLFPLFYFLSFN